MGIITEDVSLSYNGHLVLGNVSLHLKKGAVITLLGPNGCGKTTLLKVINGLLHPGQGKVYVDGKDVARMKQTDMARLMGYVPQTQRNSFPFTALDIVLTGRMPHLSMLAQPGAQGCRKSLPGSANGRSVSSFRQTLHPDQRRRTPVGDDRPGAGPGTVLPPLGRAYILSGFQEPVQRPQDDLSHCQGPKGDGGHDVARPQSCLDVLGRGGLAAKADAAGGMLAKNRCPAIKMWSPPECRMRL